jgi:hypothetical protein
LSDRISSCSINANRDVKQLYTLWDLAKFPTGGNPLRFIAETTKATTTSLNNNEKMTVVIKVLFLLDSRNLPPFSRSA